MLITYVRAVKSVSADAMARKVAILTNHFDLDQTDPAALLRDLISTINVNIERFGFKIDAVRDQANNSVIYVFINTRFDEIIQGCTTYTPAELDTLKQVIDGIVTARNYAFSMLYAMAKQRTTAVLKQKTSDGVNLMQRFVDDGWLEITDLGRVVLSALCLAELRTYLDDKYGFFSDSDLLGKLLRCHVCGDTVTLGCKCDRSECPVAYHKKCLSVFQRNGEECPGNDCSSSILETTVVGPV